MDLVAERIPDRIEMEGVEAEFNSKSGVAAKMGCFDELTHVREACVDE